MLLSLASSLLNYEIKKKYGKYCHDEGGNLCEYCGVEFQLNILSCIIPMYAKYAVVLY
jgi:hypothetical protein